MPSTEEIEVFKFEELPDKANAMGRSPKERARDWYREAFSDMVVDGVSQTFETELEIRGLTGLKSAWSLSYSQGDGVAFEGSIDLADIKPVEQGGPDRPDEELDKRHIAAITAAMGGIPADEFQVTVSSHNAHYSHALSFSVEVTCYTETDEGEPGFSDDEIEALEDAVLAWLQDLSRQFEKMGYAEIEYQESDDEIAESCDANEYRFDASGRPIHHLLPKGSRA